MYINKLKISGYKNFSSPFEITFSNGLNILVGENGVGKTGIINAIRMLLLEDEFGRSSVSDTDFYKSFSSPVVEAEQININCHFTDLDSIEEIAFQPWDDSEYGASLNLQVDNKSNYKGRFKRTIWGGVSKASAFEWELFDTVNCIYLPPLRDAEAKLREGKSSRLARLLKNLCKKKLDECKTNQTKHPLEEAVSNFNSTLSTNNEAIKGANDLIKKRLEEALGSVFGQETLIQFSEQNFNRIVESLRLLFFPRIGGGTTPDLFRSLDENSLGYNNLLYLATVLAELTEDSTETEYVKVLLIEEPEAHLHPQLQIRLLKYLEQIANSKNIQIIVTTHSPVLSSAVSVDSLIHLASSDDTGVIATPVKECGLNEKTSLKFITRWLDATKSTLLFAKGVILVEGIAEAMLIPEIAKKVLQEYNTQQGVSKLPISLEDGGVSVINMNGIYFKHFMQLFCNITDEELKNIPIRCSGITDQDPPKKVKTKNGDTEHDRGKFYPIVSDIESNDGAINSFKYPPTILDKELSEGEEIKNELKGKNHALPLIGKINTSEYARLYANQLKTLEYDLAMESNNLNTLLAVAIKVIESPTQKLKDYENIAWTEDSEEIEKAKASHYFLSQIEDIKGEFSQKLADEITTCSLEIPLYIKNAIIWACGGSPYES